MPGQRRFSRRRFRPPLRAVALAVATALTLVAAPHALAEPMDPAQDSLSNPEVAVMPAGSVTTGEFVGVRAQGSVVVSQKWYSDLRTVDIGIRSRALQATVPVRVVLPPGWRRSTFSRYPIALFLHGGNDNYTSWTRESDVAERAAGYNMITVFPEAGRTASYADHRVRSATAGPNQWETFHLREVTAIVRRAFGGDTSRMGVVGLSSGGYGAAAYATRNPGMFRFMGVLSGPLDIEETWTQALIMNTPVPGTKPTDRFGDPIVDAANWRAHNPMALAQNLRGTSVFISSGLTGKTSPADTAAGNEWSSIQNAEALGGAIAQRFAARLAELNIPATTDFYELGHHNWPAWRLELPKLFPQLVTALGAAPVRVTVDADTAAAWRWLLELLGMQTPAQSPEGLRCGRLAEVRNSRGRL